MTFAKMILFFVIFLHEDCDRKSCIVIASLNLTLSRVAFIFFRSSIVTDRAVEEIVELDLDDSPRAPRTRNHL